MLTDILREIIAALTDDRPDWSRNQIARAIAENALPLAAEREPPADVVVVPRAVVLACADLCDVLGSGASRRDAVMALDGALGIRGSWSDTVAALRRLASAPRPEPADRLVGQVTPAVPAVDPQPVAVAGAATLADVEALRAEVDDLRRLLAQGLTIAGRRLDGSAGPSLVDLARNLSCPSPSR